MKLSELFVLAREILPKGSGYFFLALFYLFCAAGYVDSSDATPSVETAIQLVDHGTFAMTELGHSDRMFYTHGKAGCTYSKMGITFPLLYTVPVLLAKMLAPLFPDKRLLIGFLVSLINPIITACIILLLYVFFRRRHGIPHAIAIIAVAGLGTLLLPYSKTCHREPLQALCLLGSFVFFYGPVFACWNIHFGWATD